MLLFAGTALSCQTTFGMNERTTNQPTAITHASATFQKSPSFMARLLAKTSCIKNWALTHKKPLLIGAGMVMTIVAAYVGHEYFLRTPQAIIDGGKEVIVNPATELLVSHAQASPEIVSGAHALLAAADACAYPKECLSYNGATVQSCAFYANMRQNSAFQKCYDKVIAYAQKNGLHEFNKHISAAMEKAGQYWKSYFELA